MKASKTVFLNKNTLKKLLLKECPNIDLNGTKCEVLGTKPCCGLCGCSLSLKTRSLSSECADSDNIRWKAVLTEQEDDQLNNHLNSNQ